MKKETPLIRIVDDDDSLRESLVFLFDCEGLETASYPDTESFLREDFPSRPGCIILDVRMPAVSGIALQQELNRRGNTLPIIFLTAHGDIDMAVQSLHDGAFDFQQKPVDPPKLITAVMKAIKKNATYQGETLDVPEALHRYQSLTTRENEVMRLVAQGFLNRQIAERLSLSKRTIEVQRASAKRKLKIDSASELADFFQTVDQLRETGSLKEGS